MRHTVSPFSNQKWILASKLTYIQNNARNSSIISIKIIKFYLVTGGHSNDENASAILTFSSFLNDKTFSTSWFGMTIGDAIGKNDPFNDKNPTYGTGKPTQTM